jgi:Rrf2 family transcriptional repressor of oqxAB
MLLDTRFPTALQAMLLLAVAAREAKPTLSSTQLARALGTNPSLVRKLLVPLVRDGFVLSSAGRNGGVRLALPAERITLRDVFRSTVSTKPLWDPRPDGPHVCMVSTNAHAYFASLTSDAERVVLDMLGSRTLADSLRDIESIAQNHEERAHGRGSPVRHRAAHLHQ